ncbi:MAG: MarR family transcriptional regulator [Stappiaceae bacterium]
MTHHTTTTPRPVLTLDSQLCFALYAASNTIDQYYRPLLEAHDLTYAQYIVLMALAEEDQVSITALATRLGLSRATMTPLLRRLEAKKLLWRRIKEGNERRKSITLTPEGRALWSESCRVTDHVFSQTKLSMEQATDLIAPCKIITRRCVWRVQVKKCETDAVRNQRESARRAIPAIAAICPLTQMCRGTYWSWRKSVLLCAPRHEIAGSGVLKDLPCNSAFYRCIFCQL